jgi:hypothetical protein
MESITNVRRPLLYYSVIYSLRRFSVSDKAADVSELGSTNPLFKSEIETVLLTMLPRSSSFTVGWAAEAKDMERVKKRIAINRLLVCNDTQFS